MSQTLKASVAVIGVDIGKNSFHVVGQDQDDFDVLEDGVIFGRIFKVPIAPQDRPWMWASGHNRRIRRAVHGYEPGGRMAAPGQFAAQRQRSGMSALVECGRPS
jgi:hypothetical protein